MQISVKTLQVKFKYLGMKLMIDGCQKTLGLAKYSK